MHHDFLGSVGLQETHMDALKSFNFQIGNIDNERRFLYKIRHSGPLCGMSFALEMSHYDQFDLFCLKIITDLIKAYFKITSFS